MIIPIIVAIIASTGFWTFLTRQMDKKDDNSPENQMLKGLAHDRICFLAEHYIERGYINREEFENLHDYLYEPYKRLGGNGTAERLMDAVAQLPLNREGD